MDETYYSKNKDKCIEYQLGYYKANKDYIREYNNYYYNTVRCHKRPTLKRGGNGQTFDISNNKVKIEYQKFILEI